MPGSEISTAAEISLFFYGQITSHRVYMSAHTPCALICSGRALVSVSRRLLAVPHRPWERTLSFPVRAEERNLIFLSFFFNFSKSLHEYSKDFTVSLVLGKDVIPRWVCRMPVGGGRLLKRLNAGPHCDL